MLDISPQHLRQLRETLQNCAPIDSNEQLRAVFIDSRISLWRNNIPQANDVASRIDLAIDFFRDKYDDNQQNALILLLYVLADGVPDGDSCKQRFLKLAQELEYINSFPSDEIRSNTQLLSTRITLKQILLHPAFIPVVVLLTLSSALIIVPNVRNWVGLNPTVTPTSTIKYIGAVIDSRSKNPVQDALIAFEFTGKTPIKERTNPQGIYNFTINFDENKLNGRVQVRKDGCDFYDEEITINKDKFDIQDIRLICASIPNLEEVEYLSDIELTNKNILRLDTTLKQVQFDMCGSPQLIPIIPDGIDPIKYQSEDILSDLETWFQNKKFINRTPIEIMVTSLSAKEWVRITNGIFARVVSYQPLKNTKVVGSECGGLGKMRKFSDIQVNSNLSSEFIANIEGVDFFTLQPGEFEVFSVDLIASEPGLYEVEIGIEFSYQGKTYRFWSGQTFFVYTPNEYLTWFIEIRDENFRHQNEIYLFKDGIYEKASP